MTHGTGNGLSAGTVATFFFTVEVLLVLLELALELRHTVTELLDVLAPTLTLPLLFVAVQAACAGDTEIRFEKISSKKREIFTRRS